MKYSFIIITFIGFLLLNSLSISAQTKQELEQKKEKLNREIDETNKLLDETTTNRKKTYNEFVLVNRKISLRENLIQSLEKEISILEGDIESKIKQVRSLENDLVIAKNEYAKLLCFMQKNRKTYSVIYYLLSAKSFNQAYKRYKYLQQYQAYRKKQISIIEAIQKTLYMKIIALETEVNNKKVLVYQRVDETSRLSNERAQKDQLVKQLKKKEEELKADLKEKENIAKKLENEIIKIIAEEQKKSTGKSLYEQLTPEEKLISDSFTKNLGKLPWPTKFGFISSTFGEHEHPFIKGTKVRNNGVDITTVKSAEVRSVFDGEVSKVVSILGANYTVIIRHGNYLTVYQNLSSVYVKKGDKVVTKDVIGLVYNDETTNSSVLHFEIWEELKKQNPELWLTKL
jgi:murein hydrolase activator